MDAKFVQIVTKAKTGKRYPYYRRFGKRVTINSEIGSPEFFAEIAKIEASFSVAEGPAPGTLGYLVTEYKQSDWWTDLKPKTQLSYQRAFDALGEASGIPIAALTRSAIIKIRDEAIRPTRGRWMANYVVTVLGVLLAFAFDKGDIASNPLTDRVRKIRTARGTAPANRPWTEQERTTVLAEAPAQIRLAIALAMASGLRKADVLTATMSSVADGKITVRTSKRGKRIGVPIHPMLADALERRPPSDAVQIALNSDGKPWTENGFNSSWQKFKGRLEAAGKIGPGLTIHGLRHTLGTLLKEAGLEDGQIADVLGQSGTAMPRHYSREAELSETAKAAVVKLKLVGKPRTNL